MTYCYRTNGNRGNEVQLICENKTMEAEADCNMQTSDAMYRDRGELGGWVRVLVLVFSSRLGRINPPLDLSVPGPKDWRAQRPAG